MSIKELIFEKHKEAENTLFFKSIIGRKLPKQIWYNFLLNKMLILSCIEEKIDHIEGLSRVNKLRNDILSSEVSTFQIKNSTFEYVKYIKNIDNNLLFAHVYVWYMGDLNGGKMIKKIINSPNTNLEFENPDFLKNTILEKIDISMIDEINSCFDWVNKLLKEFDEDILQESK